MTKWLVLWPMEGVKTQMSEGRITLTQVSRRGKRRKRRRKRKRGRRKRRKGNRRESGCEVTQSE